MSVAWFVARRYLTARRRQAFISLISAVSVLGVGVGVMALIIALGLMTGVQEEVRDRIVGSSAHVYVYKAGPMRDVEAERAKVHIAGVEASAPVVTTQGIVTTRGGRHAPVQLRGVDPVLESDVTEIDGAMEAGNVADLIGRRPDQHAGILLGEDLAANLAVSVGDTVFFISMRGTPTPGGGVIPRQRAFEVVGLFRFGLLQMDTATAVIAIDEASEMLGKQGPDLLELRVSGLERAVPIRRELQDLLGSGYIVQDWTQLNEPLYAALWLEKVAIALTIGLIIMVAALNIVASLVLLVMEKSRDIAILRTMGASARTIRRIFVYQGLTIGLVGTTAGTVLGLIVCWIADRYELISLPSDVYQIAYLPFRVEPFDVLAVFASAVLVCLVATVYPSRQAGRLDPAEALRNQ